jgi:hypothetical protein
VIKQVTTFVARKATASQQSNGKAPQHWGSGDSQGQAELDRLETRFKSSNEFFSSSALCFVFFIVYFMLIYLIFINGSYSLKGNTLPK